MSAVHKLQEGLTYNPDTGNYHVHDVAGAFIGDTTQRTVAYTWWLYASGCGSRGASATPTRRALGIKVSYAEWSGLHCLMFTTAAVFAPTPAAGEAFADANGLRGAQARAYHAELSS
jgi:hypothetical protein